MTSDNFQKVEDLFHEARQLDPAERAAFLDKACAGDLELRAEVESLLAHSDDMTERIDISPSGEGFRAVLTPRNEDDDSRIVDRGPLIEKAGTRIGRYKILQEIGEGGFGVVYMAEQEEPVQRKVALKIIKLGMDTKQVIARFEAERQALAMMDHPNIARVLDAGATETGRPYFVMELVKGIPISEYCDKAKLSTRQRLALFMDVCNAVQHAHQKGIIHRDLKPSNVLVTLHDSRAVPKVIDFGIAKATSRRLTEKTLFTEFRQLIGTPEYMSPDQAEISGLDVDTRTDIYSLGVLLYELLTGTTPFDGQALRSKGYGEIQRIITEVDPPKPSTRMETLATGESGADIAHRRQAEPGALSRLMRGDLDWIVMKAIEKDRTRRYQSASELAGDIQRHLDKEPILAGPPSVIYRFRKFVSRHRLGFVAGLLITAALVIGLSLAAVGFVEARQEARRSQRIADFLQNLFISTNPTQAVSQNADVERVLATAREVFGDDHATVAATLASRAGQLHSSGNFEDAERLYRESLRIWRDLYGDDNVNISATLSGLGLLLFQKGDYVGAEEVFRESIRVMRAQSDEEILAISEPLAILAQVLLNTGETEEAIECLRESVDVRRRTAPEQRMQIAITINSLVNVLALAGQDAVMFETVPEALQAWRDATGPESLLMGQVATQYGRLYLQYRDLENAEPLLSEGLEIFLVNDEPAPFHRNILMRCLGAMHLRRVEAGGDAREHFGAFVDETDRLLAVSDPEYVPSLLEFTEALKDFGQPVLAMRLCRRALQSAKAGDDESQTDEVIRELGNLGWDIARRPDRSEEDYTAALGAIEEAIAEDPDSPAFTNTLGVAQYRLGRYEDALATLAVSDTFYSENEADGLPCDVAFIAMAHHQLGNADEARAAYARLAALMLNPSLAADEGNQAFAAEAEALLGEAVAPAPEP